MLRGEARTAAIVAESATRLEESFLPGARFPAPDDRAQLPRRALDGAEGALLDGFGRPFVYRASGALLTARYQLRSPGFDGVAGTDDDLCWSDESPLLKKGKAWVARGLRKHGGTGRWIASELQEVRALGRCDATR
jgi:hypothetical protein